MAKRILAFALFVILVFAVAGCSQNGNSETNTNNSKVTIKEPTYNSLDDYKKSGKEEQNNEEQKEEDQSQETTATPDSKNETVKETPQETNDDQAYGYCANVNTEKFHRMDCSSVKQMKPENMLKTNDKEKLIIAGYTPCANCKP